MSKQIAIIGGGAAGFFGAIHAALANPDADVYIFEKGKRVLDKVRISGGGRCNVTHHCFEAAELVKNYPRGERELLGPFHRFGPTDTIRFFESRGVKIKAEDDGRMFPVSDSSQSIIDCLIYTAEEAGVRIIMQKGISSIKPQEDGKILLAFSDNEEKLFDAVLVAAGGSPNEAGFNWLKELGHTIVKPVPSLFTFNIPASKLSSLMGVTVKNVQVKIAGSKLQNIGPVLITHWGVSGPGVLKLSSLAARELAERNYDFTVILNWANSKEESAREFIIQQRTSNPKKRFSTSPLFNLPSRMWNYLLDKCNISEGQTFGQLTKDEFNRLIQYLTADQYPVKGKTTFKEEFVTSGGISLKEVDFKTMMSRKVPNLYFAGEVLDIDAVTGGFNFQAAWTTGYIAGTSM